MIATITKPRMVAMGTTFFGLRICSLFVATLSTPTKAKINMANPDMMALPAGSPETFQFCLNRVGSKSSHPAVAVMITEIRSKVTVLDTTFVIMPTPRRDRTTKSQISIMTVMPSAMG